MQLAKDFALEFQLPNGAEGIGKGNLDILKAELRKVNQENTELQMQLKQARKSPKKAEKPTAAGGEELGELEEIQSVLQTDRPMALKQDNVLQASQYCLSVLEGELEVAKASNAELTAEVETSQEAMKTLQNSLNEATAQAADLEDALAAAKDGSGNNDPAPSPRVTEHNKQRIGDLERDLAKAKAETRECLDKKLEVELATTRGELEATAAADIDIERLEKDLVGVREELAGKEAALEEAKEACEELFTSGDALKRRCAQLQAQLNGDDPGSAVYEPIEDELAKFAPSLQAHSEELLLLRFQALVVVITIYGHV